MYLGTECSMYLGTSCFFFLKLCPQVRHGFFFNFVLGLKTMPRSKGNKKRPQPSSEIIAAAVNDIMKNKMSLRAAEDKQAYISYTSVMDNVNTCE